MSEPEPSVTQPVAPEDIAIDEQGRVVVTNPVLAAALQAGLAPGAAPVRGMNMRICGWGC